MALTKCAECSEQMSRITNTCPHCGEKVKKSIRWISNVVLAISTAAMFLPLFSIGSESGGPKMQKEAGRGENSAATVVKMESAELRQLDKARRTPSIVTVKATARWAMMWRPARQEGKKGEARAG